MKLTEILQKILKHVFEIILLFCDFKRVPLCSNGIKIFILNENVCLNPI